MDHDALGTRLRALRIRRGLRQADVARLVGISASTVSRLERGGLAEVTVGTVESLARVLDARLWLDLRWRGGDLERLVSHRHAALAELVVARLRALGWQPRPEVSFAFAGERGIVDVLAWHAPSRTVLVVELKTELVDVGEMLGTFDRKIRLARRIAALFPWEPAQVGAVLIAAESSANRRRARAFSGSIAAALPDDGRRAAAWFREPSGALRARMFLADSRPMHAISDLAGRKRVRRR